MNADVYQINVHLLYKNVEVDTDVSWQAKRVTAVRYMNVSVIQCNAQLSALPTVLPHLDSDSSEPKMKSELKDNLSAAQAKEKNIVSVT